MKLIFVGLSGYQYPHTRVRCYHFANMLREKYNIDTEVLSFRDNLAPHLSEVDMYESLNDKKRLLLTAKAIKSILVSGKSISYIQKAHTNSAAPYLLYKLLGKDYIFDYDDYDVNLSVLFHRGILNRLIFGTNKWDDILYKLASRARACVVSSRSLEKILSIYNSKVYRVPTGVDVNRFAPKEKADMPIKNFLWTGLVWGKEIFDSVVIMLEAFSELNKKHPDTNMTIIGSGQLMPQLKYLASKKYINVNFIDWVHPDDMPAKTF